MRYFHCGNINIDYLLSDVVKQFTKYDYGFSVFYIKYRLLYLANDARGKPVK